jgi:hypothetical protein
LQDDPVAGQRIVEAKQAAFAQAAEQVKGRDPDAYEYFVGRRSDARVGYALLSTVAVLCAVPFLLASAFLVLGALIIIRFGVMLFPAIATLGMFPTMRGLVVGLGNTMAAALINALVFGIGTAVTVRGIGVIMDPANGLAPWLVVVMVLLLTVVMWFALRPFRRLTLMVTPGGDHFGTAVGGFGGVAQGARRAAGRIVTTAAGVFAGTSASAAARDDDTATAGSPSAAPQRAEADIGPPTTSGVTGPRAGPAAGTGTTAGTPGTAAGGAAVGAAAVAASRPLTALGPAPSRTEGGAARDDPAAQEERVPAEARTGTAGWSPSPSPGGELPAPIEPAEIDGEEVFVLYRPDRSTGDGVRADA